MQCWDYLDTVEVIGSIPVAPIGFLFLLQSFIVLLFPSCSNISSRFRLLIGLKLPRVSEAACRNSLRIRTLRRRAENDRYLYG